MTTTWLFITLLVCHYLGDFTHLSRPYMLQAKRFGHPKQPIFDHAATHGFLVGLAVGLFTGSWLAWAVALAIETVTHFWIDVLKGKMNVWFPSVANPQNYSHWYLFGADQFLHVLVLIFITYFI